jgi:hypothetical protein
MRKVQGGPKKRFPKSRAGSLPFFACVARGARKDVQCPCPSDRRLSLCPDPRFSCQSLASVYSSLPVVRPVIKCKKSLYVQSSFFYVFLYVFWSW